MEHNLIRFLFSSRSLASLSDSFERRPERLSFRSREPSPGDRQSQEWIHRQIKGSQFEVFEEAEGGQHFMFIENPEKFNRLVMEYLG